ncbi:hypothetical protein ACN27B_29675 [Micromonospora sp. WMMD754]|uniref:hypothetical protein n=1 Tax=Micromonospora sp. WMMD754 TaxID=3404114 RepID=UPI003BF608A2
MDALRDAEPEHKLEVYRSLGLHLTYDPESQTVRANVDLATHRWDSVRVRGATRTVTPPPMTLSTTLKLAPPLLNERPVPDGTGRFFTPAGATGTDQPEGHLP